MVTLRFRLTQEEYFQYNYFTAWADPGKKSYRRAYFFRVMLLYGVVAALYILSNQTHNIAVDISVFVLTGAVYLLMVPIFIKWSVRRRVKDILSKKENLHVLDDAEIELTDTGILDKDAVSESRYGWDAIVRKVETPNSFYLYTNSYHAIVIPKRTIKSQEERQEMERLFNRYLPLSAEING
ncbi:MAG TPA: YcxB family protein [Flavitalea sp.]|nr:YcxB family protein [Flavitalea sp.]